MGMVADSEDPQRHLFTALIVTAIVEIGFFVWPDNRPEAGALTERESAFWGGGASERW